MLVMRNRAPISLDSASPAVFRGHVGSGDATWSGGMRHSLNGWREWRGEPGSPSLLARRCCGGVGERGGAGGSRLLTSSRGRTADCQTRKRHILCATCSACQGAMLTVLLQSHIRDVVNGLTTVISGKRWKSRSAVTISEMPCSFMSAAMCASNARLPVAPARRSALENQAE